MSYYNNQHRNNAGRRNFGYGGASYVWRVCWLPANGGNIRYKAFANKQQALIFMSRLESQGCVVFDVEKWFG